jgi:hypothetical protein
MFEPFGLFGKVIDVTPMLPGDFVRGREIEQWLNGPHPKSFDIKSFVIIDDDRDMEPFMDRLVQTDTHKGLTKETADQAILLLTSA